MLAPANYCFLHQELCFFVCLQLVKKLHLTHHFAWASGFGFESINNFSNFSYADDSKDRSGGSCLIYDVRAECTESGHQPILILACHQITHRIKQQLCEWVERFPCLEPSDLAE